jgi:hypothetical protein
VRIRLTGDIHNFLGCAATEATASKKKAPVVRCQLNQGKGHIRRLKKVRVAVVSASPSELERPPRMSEQVITDDADSL